MTDTQSVIASDEDRALKAKHRAVWASGDYPELASDLIWSLGPRVVEATGIRPGDRVLDIAAGSGNAAIAAALKGARVIASDLTPELFEAGRRLATEAGVELEWRTADAEYLPFDEGSFDAVISTVGVMFAPHHELAADEVIRATRSGGRIGLINWTPSGFIGRVFATMKPFNAPLPPGAQPAPLWGDESHVRNLFGDRIDDVSAVRESVTIDRFATGAEFRDYFKSHYGPTIAVYGRIADDAAQVAELDAALAELGDSHITDGTMDWEYLLFTARVR